MFRINVIAVTMCCISLFLVQSYGYRHYYSNSNRHSSCPRYCSSNSNNKLHINGRSFSQGLISSRDNHHSYCNYNRHILISYLSAQMSDSDTNNYEQDATAKDIDSEVIEKNNYQYSNSNSNSNSSSNSNNEEVINSSITFGKDYEYSSGIAKSLGFTWQRFFLYNTLALFLALGANFVGITSFIMSNTNPDYYRSLNLDQLYSISGYRKNLDSEDKYQFLFPQDWLVDQAIVMANANDRALPEYVRTKKQQLRPDIAYGPVRGDNKENVSVIKSSVMPGFSLKNTLGEPREAAEKLLRNSIAPANSGKTFELLDASESVRDGMLTYQFEYTLKNDQRKLFQHNIAVIAGRGTELFTLTVTVPESMWDKEGEKLSTIANSFVVTPQNIPVGFY